MKALGLRFDATVYLAYAVFFSTLPRREPAECSIATATLESDRSHGAAMQPKPRPPERDYSHRAVLDKLGIKPGDALTVDEASGPLDPAARDRLEEQLGGPLAEEGPFDVVLVVADASIDLVGLLEKWKAQIDPAGGIWLLTPKRTVVGYVKDTNLIDAGKAAGVVDNKVCSVSDATSAMRFVFRKADRPKRLASGRS